MQGQKQIDIGKVFNQLTQLKNRQGEIRVAGERLIVENISKDRKGINVTIMNLSISDTNQSFRITPTEIHSNSSSRTTTPSEKLILDVTGVDEI